MLDASNAALGLTFAVDLFVSEMPELPDECVCIYDTGGFDPASIDERYEYPTVEVMVRGNKMGYVAGWDLAQDIKDILHKLYDETWNSTKYIGIWCVGDVNYIGYDQSQRPLFSINFRIHRTA